MSHKIVVGCGVFKVGSGFIAKLLNYRFLDVSVCKVLSQSDMDAVRIIPVVSKEDLLQSLHHLENNKRFVSQKHLLFVMNHRPSSHLYKKMYLDMFLEFQELIRKAGFEPRLLVLPVLDFVDFSSSFKELRSDCAEHALLGSLDDFYNGVQLMVGKAREHQFMLDKVRMAALLGGMRGETDLPKTSSEAMCWSPPDWVWVLFGTSDSKIQQLNDVISQEIDNRDYWENKAVALAKHVGDFFDADVGEQTTDNCPVAKAYELIEEHKIELDVK
ncbi:hypothetical protein [Pseudoalteromonas marina]|uniref:Uncharacterized protein n=1 Tax=Pseudoalteromonas marina TaxID=267375 RepID=A0ABT9FD83_9GAMM|nr:hypothetical protein [Pseudoalteromonas marina]MDP2564441.1 hypothetical protein [Pseudoalteromonas marina]